MFYSQDFLDGEKATTYLSDETRNELIHRATFDITGRYHGQATDLVNLVSREIYDFLIVLVFLHLYFSKRLSVFSWTTLVSNVPVILIRQGEQSLHCKRYVWVLNKGVVDWAQRP